MVSAAEPLSRISTPDAEVLHTAKQRANDTNVGEIERVASVMIGSLLIAAGLKRFSLLGLGVAGAGAMLVHRGSTGYCPMYSSLHVTSTSSGSKTFTHPFNQNIRVEKSVSVNKPADEVFKYWRNFENLPRFMEHLEEVKVIDPTRSHWVARAPRGKTVSWDAEITNEVENKLIAWRSVEGADVPNAGQVQFEQGPDGRGTEVKVLIAYNPPAGVVGALVAKLFGEEPNQQVEEDLRHFKQIMEAGEIPTIDGQSKGTGS